MDKKQYEKFAKDVFEEISKLDGLEILESWHDQDVEGRSGAKHQIDAFVKVQLLGEELDIYIEAKYWQGPVDKPNVMTFKGVLDDLPGNKKGLMVSRKGFDEGNIWPLCKSYGIGLWTIDEVDDSGFHLTFEAFSDGLSNIEVLYDQKADKKLLEQIWNQPDDQVVFYKPDGTVIGDRSGLYNQMGIFARANAKEGGPVAINFPDGREAFLKKDEQLIRIHSVVGKRTRKKIAEETAHIRQTYMVRLLTGDNRYFVDQHGVVRRADTPIDIDFEFADPAAEDGVLRASISFELKEIDSDDPVSS